MTGVIPFKNHEVALSDFVKDLSKTTFTPFEAMRKSGKIIKLITGTDPVESLVSENDSLKSQLEMMEDAALRALKELKWMVASTECQCIYHHTCGLDERLREIDRIESTMKLSKGLNHSQAMH